MSTFLSARIENEINAVLCAIANQEGKTKTDIVKEALNLYLKNKQSKLSKQMDILHNISNSDILNSYGRINNAI